ncbi:unnamed protein product [Vitrella brassicaformis CCMP3155]|uniref:Methyltransferase type 11 domain-containing protein n=1 Tax=Vitrella brassicaformis (strain CCMP3155) TaxID=1169540 RepID=A0A0G4EB06_VITBC|nr:unnamed protein product [Vitrella brassicaformis CCMP3155]|eukprot:CEL93109.1 unnamed protein product [Vitrella brassicaformis CCMP3155]
MVPSAAITVLFLTHVSRAFRPSPLTPRSPALSAPRSPTSRGLRRLKATALRAFDIRQSLNNFSGKGNFPDVPPENQTEPGLKVEPYMWKWPPAWPFRKDQFKRTDNTSDIEFFSTADIRPFFDEPARIALTNHYARCFPSGAISVLDIGAGSYSYLPGDRQYARVVGIGINQDELDANPALTESFVVDLNSEEGWIDHKRRIAIGERGLQRESFDVVLISNAMEFFTKPRRVLREAWRVLKPGGLCVVAFTGGNANKEAVNKKMEWWKQMNDAQHMYITGSFFRFSASDGWADLKGFDVTPQGEAESMMNMFSGSPDRFVYAVQATKRLPPHHTEDPYEAMMGQLWTARELEDAERQLVVARLTRDFNRADTESEQESFVDAVKGVPSIYRVLKEMNPVTFPPPLRAKLASLLAPQWKNTEAQQSALRQGLGLEPPSKDFWLKLGQLSDDVSAEDRLIWLADIVPQFTGEPTHDAYVKQMIDVVPLAIDLVKERCQEWSDADVQLVAVDLAITDYMTEPPRGRARFYPWLKNFSRGELDDILRKRRDYKMLTPEEDEMEREAEREATAA